jgi:hypothetical protein
MLFLLLGHESGFFQFLFIFEVISDTSIIIYIRTRIRHLMHNLYKLYLLVFSQTYMTPLYS